MKYGNEGKQVTTNNVTNIYYIYMYIILNYYVMYTFTFMYMQCQSKSSLKKKKKNTHLTSYTLHRTPVANIRRIVLPRSTTRI